MTVATLWSTVPTILARLVRRVVIWACRALIIALTGARRAGAMVGLTLMARFTAL